VFVALGAENYFKPGAVADSKLLLFERSFGASSARQYFDNLEAVLTGGFEPENVRYFRVLWYVSEIELGLVDLK